MARFHYVKTDNGYAQAGMTLSAPEQGAVDLARVLMFIVKLLFWWPYYYTAVGFYWVGKQVFRLVQARAEQRRASESVPIDRS